MQAYEFDTVVRNGIINIPEQYLDKRLSLIKVILLTKNENGFSIPKKKRFNAMRLKTKGFTFNRDEANER